MTSDRSVATREFDWPVLRGRAIQIHVTMGDGFSETFNPRRQVSCQGKETFKLTMSHARREVMDKSRSNGREMVNRLWQVESDRFALGVVFSKQSLLARLNGLLSQLNMMLSKNQSIHH